MWEVDRRESTLGDAVASHVAGGTLTNLIWQVKTRLQLDRSLAKQAGPLGNRRYKNSLVLSKWFGRRE